MAAGNPLNEELKQEILSIDGGTINGKDRLLQKQQAGRLPVYVKEDTNK